MTELRCVGLHRGLPRSGETSNRGTEVSIARTDSIGSVLKARCFVSRVDGYGVGVKFGARGLWLGVYVELAVGGTEDADPR